MATRKRRSGFPEWYIGRMSPVRSSKEMVSKNSTGKSSAKVPNARQEKRLNETEVRGLREITNLSSSTTEQDHNVLISNKNDETTNVIQNNDSNLMEMTDIIVETPENQHTDCVDDTNKNVESRNMNEETFDDSSTTEQDHNVLISNKNDETTNVIQNKDSNLMEMTDIIVETPENQHTDCVDDTNKNVESRNMNEETFDHSSTTEQDHNVLISNKNDETTNVIQNNDSNLMEMTDIIVETPENQHTDCVDDTNKNVESRNMNEETFDDSAPKNLTNEISEQLLQDKWMEMALRSIQNEINSFEQPTENVQEQSDSEEDEDSSRILALEKTEATVNTANMDSSSGTSEDVNVDETKEDEIIVESDSDDVIEIPRTPSPFQAVPEEDDEDDDGELKVVYQKGENANIRGNMDPVLYNSCNGKLQPVIKALTFIGSPNPNMPEKQLVREMKNCLLRAGDHIENCLREYQNSKDQYKLWDSHLWAVAALYTNATSKELRSMYKEKKKKIKKATQGKRKNQVQENTRRVRIREDRESLSSCQEVSDDEICIIKEVKKSDNNKPIKKSPTKSNNSTKSSSSTSNEQQLPTISINRSQMQSAARDPRLSSKNYTRSSSSEESSASSASLVLEDPRLTKSVLLNRTSSSKPSSSIGNPSLTSSSRSSSQKPQSVNQQSKNTQQQSLAKNQQSKTFKPFAVGNSKSSNNNSKKVPESRSRLPTTSSTTHFGQHNNRWDVPSRPSSSPWPMLPNIRNAPPRNSWNPLDRFNGPSGFPGYPPNLPFQQNRYWNRVPPPPYYYGPQQ